ncbi:MAG: NTP-binding protein [Erysipelotrichia bacterium]|nr:NTP-binding protein [Erysipelotrichia bacterium]
MQWSHSRIECFEKCPFKYKLRYCDKLLTLPPDNADNALFLGTALHTGLEKGVDAGIEQYFMSYPIITDDHINEAMKLEKLISKAAKMIPKGEFEVPIPTADFTGFIDLLAPVTGFHDSEVPNVFDIYDFKYSNNVKGYKDSDQLHLYKYFFEQLHPGKTIRNLFFLFIPKIGIKKKKTEALSDFRKRIQDELEEAEPSLVQIEYDQSKVIDFLLKGKRSQEAAEFPQNTGYLCNWCEYQDYCQKGIDYMLLPKNERRNIEKVEKKVVWLYGSPFSGKTTFANKFPDPLMLNTDGNIKFVDAPYISIKDKVEANGRMSPKRVFAWAVFKDAIEELEKKENDFKTIIVDLLEDCYEHCRLYMYDQMGISHESDDSFRAWDKVRTEFLSTMKRLMNMDYENIILISHEDTSKDITKKGGDKITAIKPNLQEKTANKVAGMVDIVARVVADDNIRTLSFKTNEVIFGGGRLTVSTTEIPLDYDAFLAVYAEANANAVKTMHGEKVEGAINGSSSTGRTGRTSRTVKNTPPETEAVPAPTDADAPDEKELAESVQKEEKEAADAAEMNAAPSNPEPNSGEAEPPVEQKPVTRTRKKRGE